MGLVVLTDERFPRRRGRVFTLQWHLTNACELNCRHCYDRTDRGSLPLPEATQVLRQLKAFCQKRNVSCHICLTGGNPFAYPGFWELYPKVSQVAHQITILGNPIPIHWLERLSRIRRPRYYQISLEGLRDHNDWIRGAGHFEGSLAFLDQLRACRIPSAVMLTLTQANRTQVLDLARSLVGRADQFTFNRLAEFGQGAALRPPTAEEYRLFLQQYLEEMGSNPVLRAKDNLFNIIRYEARQPSLRGCTGAGCGAAWNFLALLPEGELHACRKFPSRVGHALGDGLERAYASATARAYRLGPDSCRGCPIRNQCGSCLAVAQGRGLDPLLAPDPDCFLDGSPACAPCPSAVTERVATPTLRWRFRHLCSALFEAARVSSVRSGCPPIRGNSVR